MYPRLIHGFFGQHESAPQVEIGSAVFAEFMVMTNTQTSQTDGACYVQTSVVTARIMTYAMSANKNDNNYGNVYLYTEDIEWCVGYMPFLMSYTWNSLYQIIIQALFLPVFRP